jgi:hypothetical protein
LTNDWPATGRSKYLFNLFLYFAGMKMIAFLLSLYVLLLASFPISGFAGLFGESVCCQEVCVEAAAEHHQSEEGGCDDLCNPFLSCSCSIGFTAAQLNTSPDLDSGNYGVHINQMEDSYLNQVIFQVWNPPKT